MAWKYIDKVRTASGRWRYIYADAKTAARGAMNRARAFIRGGKHRERPNDIRRGTTASRRIKGTIKSRSRSSSNYVLRDGHAYQANRERAARRIDRSKKKSWEFWK